MVAIREYCWGASRTPFGTGLCKEIAPAICTRGGKAQIWLDLMLMSMLGKKNQQWAYCQILEAYAFMTPTKL